MQILICAPRLDTSFKELGPVGPKSSGALPPIRQHWANFLKTLKEYHQSAGDTVDVLELPLWQFAPALIDKMPVDVVYIPHKEPRNFPYNGPGKALYYMQTVFPEYFTIDTKGWGANLSYLPLYVDNSMDEIRLALFEAFRDSRLKNNISKFDQPKRRGPSMRIYDVTFICQLPHDETIKYHSAVTVEKALQITLQWAGKHNKSVLVKGHPINPDSMRPLQDIVAYYDVQSVWMDQISIHDAFAWSNKVVTVNSGAGFEAILHGKHVIHFGRAEYAECSTPVSPTIENLDKAFNSSYNMQNKQINFLEHFLDKAYLSTDIKTFEKL